MKNFSILLITFIFLFFNMVMAADQKTTAKPQTQASDEYQKMTGDQVLAKVRSFDYAKMDDKAYIAAYQKICKKLVALDIKQEQTNCIKFLVALQTLMSCYEQGTFKNFSAAFQNSMVTEMSKGMTPEAWAGAMQQIKVTDEELQKKLIDARAAKEKQKNQQAENEANFALSQAKDFPSDDYSIGIKKLQELKKRAPTSKVIADSLALLEKFKSNLSKVTLKVLPIDVGPMGKSCKIEISNKSTLKAKNFSIMVSFLDATGKVLKTDEYQASSDNLEPPSPDGCAPGYVGVLTRVSLKDDALAPKWTKTSAKFKWVRLTE